MNVIFYVLMTKSWAIKQQSAIHFFWYQLDNCDCISNAVFSTFWQVFGGSAFD